MVLRKIGKSGTPFPLFPLPLFSPSLLSLSLTFVSSPVPPLSSYFLSSPDPAKFCCILCVRIWPLCGTFWQHFRRTQEAECNAKNLQRWECCSWPFCPMWNPYCKERECCCWLFLVTVARAWNSLPTSITALTSLPSFKRQLKTFLFTKSFPSV